MKLGNQIQSDAPADFQRNRSSGSHQVNRFTMIGTENTIGLSQFERTNPMSGNLPLIRTSMYHSAVESGEIDFGGLVVRTIVFGSGVFHCGYILIDFWLNVKCFLKLFLSGLQTMMIERLPH